MLARARRLRSPPMPAFEVHGAWLVELRDDEDRVLLIAAERGHQMRAQSWIASVRAAAIAPRVEVRHKHSRLAAAYFVLMDEWGEVFATSVLFGTERECHRMLTYLLHVLPTTPVFEVAPRRQRAANMGAHTAAAPLSNEPDVDVA